MTTPRAGARVSSARTRAGSSSSVDYAAIAAKKLRDPGLRHPRYLIYGRNKQGKTGISVKNTPNCMVIDPENGTNWLKARSDLKVWPVSEWTDINPAFRYLQMGDHPWETVVVDGLTRIHNMALRFVMKQQEDRDLDRIPGMVNQKDYGKANELMKGMLYNFHALDMTVVFTAQDRMDTGAFSDSEDEEDLDEVVARFVPDLPKGVRSSVESIVDAIGRVYTVQREVQRKNGDTVKATARRLWLATTDKYDTGFRSDFYRGVPPYLSQPSIPRLTNLLSTRKAE